MLAVDPGGRRGRGGRGDRGRAGGRGRAARRGRRPGQRRPRRLRLRHHRRGQPGAARRARRRTPRRGRGRPRRHPEGLHPRRRPARVRARRPPLRLHRRDRRAPSWPRTRTRWPARSCASPPTASPRRATRTPTPPSGRWATATCRAWPSTTRAGCGPRSSATRRTTRSTSSSRAPTTAGPVVEGPGGGDGVRRPARHLADLGGVPVGDGLRRRRTCGWARCAASGCGGCPCAATGSASRRRSSRATTAGSARWSPRPTATCGSPRPTGTAGAPRPARTTASCGVTSAVRVTTDRRDARRSVVRIAGPSTTSATDVVIARPVSQLPGRGQQRCRPRSAAGCPAAARRRRTTATPRGPGTTMPRANGQLERFIRMPKAYDATMP